MTLENILPGNIKAWLKGEENAVFNYWRNNRGVGNPGFHILRGSPGLPLPAVVVKRRLEMLWLLGGLLLLSLTYLATIPWHPWGL